MIPDGALLVGSVPLGDAETVFRRVAEALGPCIARIPDGETGLRTRWVYWQREMLERHPAMELDPEAPPLRLHEWDGTFLRESPLLRFKPGVDPDAVRFETGYGPAALQSWAVFRRLKQAGVVPAATRFQVSLPTPASSAYMYVSLGARQAYFRVYERALLAALGEILAGVPADELAIQWDVCQEVLIFEDYFPWRPADYKDWVFGLLARLGDAVPPPVELGYHLCYGSPRDRHLVMPKDTSILAEIATGIFDRLGRGPTWLHLPVPRERDDAAYFAPLAELRLPPGSRLYLGLIHHDDAAGDRARIDRARQVVCEFGIAAECGWGRTDPARVPGFLESHRAAVEYLESLD
jgi:hypothetical protein